MAGASWTSKRNRALVLLALALVGIKRLFDSPSFSPLDASIALRGPQSASQSTKEPRVIVSLATTASRVDMLERTLESISTQTFHPDQLEIHYTEDIKGQKYPVDTIVKKARAIFTALPIKVNLSEADPRWRSAAKLLGTLKSLWNGEKAVGLNEEPIIVYGDDDMVYDNQWLESLVQAAKQFPNAAVGLRGWRVRKDLVWGAPALPQGAPGGVWNSFMPLERYVIIGNKITQAYEVGVLTGVLGVAVRPKMFGSKVFLPPDEAYVSMDDVWLSGHLALHSVPRYVIPYPSKSRDIGEHLGQNLSVIDKINYEKKKIKNRGSINNMVLRYYKGAWEKDDLWWSEEDDIPLTKMYKLRHFLSNRIIALYCSLKKCFPRGGQ